MRTLATLLVTILAGCSPRTWEVGSGAFDLTQSLDGADFGSDLQFTEDLATYWTRDAAPIPAEGCDSHVGWPVTGDVAACPAVLERTADIFRTCAPGWMVCSTQPLPTAIT